MKDLTEQLQRARKAYAPKRRFEFKSSIQHDGSSPQNLEPTVDSDAKGEAPTPATVDLREKLNIGGALIKAPLSTQDASSKSALAQHPQRDVPLQITIISSLSNDLYVLDAQTLTTQSTSLTNITQSLVDLSATTKECRPSSALTVTSVKQSLLICGSVAGAAHITGMEKSTLIMNSRQVRLHNCVDCVLYLRCSSRPIIEDCKDIRFAPLPRVLVSKQHGFLQW